ncbi:chs6p [Saccharomyces arboricola H-6]|uniref:Chs6p n=1 Tax=Saccharomyces arboricola (strain H-6 / AS 2.3317 / CBS 10644) TaxID=1160507 RepID=J8Q0K3_SACAR|nr:chs6p [Saccharomyces arboricola H-6]
MNLFWTSETKKQDEAPRKDYFSGNQPQLQNFDQCINRKIFHSCPRILERKFGQCLHNRTHLIKDLISSGNVGLGPIEIVHMSYSNKHEKEEFGEYFYVTGIEVSSSSIPIEFLKLLKSSQRVSKNISSEIIFTFCCFNFFNKLDVRIRYDADGTFQIKAIDCNTETTDLIMTEKMWEETFVSSIIRTVITNSEPEFKPPGLLECPFYIEKDTVSSCKKIIELLCRFLPRSLDCGWDSTKSMQITIVNNYLMYSLKSFIAIAPGLVDFTIDYLKELTVEDPINNLQYKVAMITILDHTQTRELEMVAILNETMDSLLSMLNVLPPRDADSAQLMNCMSDLLNIQARFLISRGDYKLALDISNTSTELALDCFESWYNLAKCHIKIEEYEKALFAINSMPRLHKTDQALETLYSRYLISNYYRKPLNGSQQYFDLTSTEYTNISGTLRNCKEDELKQQIFGRIAMINEEKVGYTKEIWDDIAMKLGPIYGPQSVNLINYVSPQEVKNIKNINLIARNTIGKQLGWFNCRIYELLMEIINKIGWNGLLNIRTDAFMMETEFYLTSTNTTDENGHIPMEARKKRFCERWLDDLFLDLYQDLKLSKISLNNKDEKHNGLEWELLGLTMLRTWQWEDAVACLRTSIVARFDPVSCYQLLKLYLNPPEDLQDITLLDTDTVVDLLINKISYDCRFYNYCQIFNLQVLYKLCNELEIDILRNKVLVLPSTGAEIMAVIDTMLAWIIDLRHTLDP